MTLSEPAKKQDRPIDLVAIINSFNRRELLQRAVAALTQGLRNAPFGSAIIVFDAGSNDGSKEFLENWRAQNPDDNLIIVLPEVDRTSFSAGVNIGCVTALTRYPTCRWLLLYETDNCLARFEPLGDAISLLEVEPQLAAVGFTVKRHDGSACGYGMRFPNCVSLALGQNLALRWDLYRPNDSVWRQTGDVRWRTSDIVFTSPLLVRREAWEQTGGFDTECFPFSDSDLDWAWRCAKSGWKMAVIATQDVIHDNLEQMSAWSANRVIDFHRSRLRLLKRHRGNHVALIKPILFLRHSLEFAALAVAGDPASKEKLTKQRQLIRTVWTNYS